MDKEVFCMLQCVLKLMAENKLRKDIDDTLLEKLLTLIQNYKLQPSNKHDLIVIERKNNQGSSSDFIKELINKTDALSFIESTLISAAQKNDSNYIMIQSFFIRLLGLIFEKTDNAVQYEKLLPLLKHSNGIIISDHNPSIQDALLFCLSCVSRKYDGALWFVNQNLQDFVLSSFNSSSYYVRKSSVNFFTNFILQWAPYLSIIDQKKPGEHNLEAFIKNFISFVIGHIHFYRSAKEMLFAECCIAIIKQLIESKNCYLSDIPNLAKSMSDCFIELSDEKQFNEKLIDLFLAIHFKFSLPEDSINDVIKCLITKKDVTLAMDLSSSFAKNTKAKHICSNEVKFFLLPAYILLNEPIVDCDNYFTYNANEVYCIISKKMEDKSDCKLLFSSSLSALAKIIPRLDSSYQRHVGQELLKLVKCSIPCHKWLYSVLEDRLVHHSLIDFYSSLLADDVYPSLIYEKTDLLFQNILEYLKKSTTDSNFLSRLLLLMKNILHFHKKHEFNLEEGEKNDLIQAVCRSLHDKRESVVDSAIHLSGEIIGKVEWQDKVFQQSIHIILWDIAVHGNLDGAIRSTALKVVIEGCQESMCLNEIKSSKNLTEIDIAKKLFILTCDPDYFLQREALSCLYMWIKSKWNEFEFSSSCIEYLYVSLVSAIQSLDLELKLISLDVWKWLLENKHTLSNISPSLNLKDYVNYLATSGFGLSMILALEDYDEAVQYKAATILHELKNTLMSCGSTFDSLQLDSTVDDGPREMTSFENLIQPISKEERDKGIDIVMELSTSEQIANICHPFTNYSDIKEDMFFKERTCNVSSFWICLWSENVTTVLESAKKTSNTIDAVSILKDIISARVVENDSIEDIPDCY